MAVADETNQIRSKMGKAVTTKRGYCLLFWDFDSHRWWQLTYAFFIQKSFFHKYQLH